MYFKHKKSGGVYTLTAIVVRESDLVPLAAYTDERGLTWTRPGSEFFDGRYEVYIPAPKAPGAGYVQ